MIVLTPHIYLLDTIRHYRHVLLVSVSILINPLTCWSFAHAPIFLLTPLAILLWGTLRQIQTTALSKGAVISALGVMIFSSLLPFGFIYILAIAVCLPLISPQAALRTHTLPLYLIVLTPAVIAQTAFLYAEWVHGLSNIGPHTAIGYQNFLWEDQTDGSLLTASALMALWCLLLLPAHLFYIAQNWQATQARFLGFTLLVTAIAAGIAVLVAPTVSPLFFLTAFLCSALFYGFIKTSPWPFYLNLFTSWLFGWLAVQLYG